MLYMNQNEINEFYGHVIRRVASSPKVNIPDHDLKSITEIYQEIMQAHTAISALLQMFLAAYQEWYDIHVKIDAAGTAGNLSQQEQSELHAAIANRDQKRGNLSAAIQ